MTILDHARRSLLTASQKGRRATPQERRDAGLDWVVDRNDDLLDEQLDFPLPEPEPAQRDLFK